MSRDSQRYRKTYSYYRVQPRTEQLEIIADESLDWKHSVRAASTGNVPLVGSTPLAVDGVTLSADDRVLLKNQGTPNENGIYYVGISGGSYTLTRDTDASQGTLTCGAATYVEEGSSNAGRIYIMSTTGAITVGTTSLTWTQFTGAGGGTPGGADTQVQFNDGGSFGGVSGLTFNKTTGALTGTYVLASTGFSGSLTKLANGSDYLVAGNNISLTTGSNGSVTIAASGGSGPTGSGTDGFLTQWTGTSTLGNSFIKDMTPNGLSTYARYYKDYHQFNGNSDGGTWVQINSNGTTGGRIGIGVDPEYPLHITQTSNPVAILEFSRFRNTNAGEGSGVRQTYAAGNFSNPTFRITHVWPANAQGHYTYFGIAKPSPSGTTTPEIVERVRLFSSGTIELSGSVSVRQDSEISLNKSVFDVQKSNGDQVLWISSSAGTNPVGTDVFMFVSGSRTDNNTGSDKVVFGGDVRVSGSLTIGTGSVFITSNNIQFGSTSMRVEKNGNDIKFFDISNPSGLTLSELAAGGGGGSSPLYWTSPTSGFIYATGSVGIGTTNSSFYNLDVYQTETDQNCGVNIETNGAGASTLYLVGGNAFLTLGDPYGAPTNEISSLYRDGIGDLQPMWRIWGGSVTSNMAFDTGGVEAMRINDSQNVGIGITNPSEKLHVSTGNIKVDTAGYGVRLASSPSNADAQTLDAYYEKDLTVTLKSTNANLDCALYSTAQTLKFTRIGRMVTISGYLQVETVTSTGTGRLYIDLGTTAGERPSSNSAVALYINQPDAAIDWDNPVIGYADAGSSRIYIDRYELGQGVSNGLTLSQFVVAEQEFMVSVSYSTN